MPIHNLFHKSKYPPKPPSHHTRADEERAARQLCDQINYGLRPRPTCASSGEQFLAYDYDGVLHELCVETGGSVVPRTERRREQRVRDMGLTQAPRFQQQIEPAPAFVSAPVTESAPLPTPSRKDRTPFVNPFETEHKPLGSNGYRAYVPGQEALRASDFGERADDPRWSLKMMRARGELIRRNEAEEQGRR